MTRPVEALWFIVLGFMGGAIHVVMNAKSWGDLKKFSAFKRTILGAATGFVYSILYSEYSFPNSVMAIVSGYTGTDFLLRLFKRPLKEGGASTGPSS